MTTTPQLWCMEREEAQIQQSGWRLESRQAISTAPTINTFTSITRKASWSFFVVMKIIIIIIIFRFVKRQMFYRSSFCPIKAKIHYTCFPLASPQQVRNKFVTSWRGQTSVVSVVSCRFPTSITSTCCQLAYLLRICRRPLDMWR